MKTIQTSGRLKPDALEVPRHQTEELCEQLSRGDLVHLVGSRQIGKSTLAQTAVHRLVAEGKASHYALLDLDGILNLDAGGGFGQICSAIARGLGLREEYRSWRESEDLGDGSKILWSRFLEDLVLPRLDGRIVLVIDEIDTLLSFDPRRDLDRQPDPDAFHGRFNDDFLLAIRSFHNAGTDHEDLRRLSFCLVGSRPPAWLVTDSKRTRMNVGKTLILEDFTRDEAGHFLPHLETVCRRPEVLLDEVLAWTAGHPLFTAEIAKELEDGGKVPLRGERDAVEEIVNRLYLDDGLATHNVGVDASLRIRRDEPQAPVTQRLETYELVLERGEIDYRGSEPVHLALVLDGLAGIEQHRGDRYLVPRNEIVRRAFDLDWVQGLRRGELYRDVPEADAPSSDKLEAARRAVDEFLAEQYERQDDGTEELTGILFSFEVSTRGRVRKPLRLQVYRGLQGVAAELWEQEVRALERLSGTRNAALPVLYEAGIKAEKDLAFCLTEKGRDQLSDLVILDDLRKQPGISLREFSLLAKGLVTLQRQGLIHRNLWNGNIEVIKDREGRDDNWTLRLARFQMSTLLSNMLRRLGQDQAVDLGNMDQVAREFFRRQGREALACAPPERLAFVFDERKLDSLESPAGDVYSLGMIGYQLFVGPLPDELVMASFPDEDDGGPGFSLAAFRSFHREVRARLQIRVPNPRLGSLLAEMIEFDAARRPKIFDVVNTLQANYDRLQQSFESEEEEPLLLAYMHEQTGTQFFNRGWMVHEPETEEGEDELWDLLNQDLRNTHMTFSERGAAPYVDRPDARHERAQFVLLGRRATYFGQLFEDRRTAGTTGLPLPQVFLITFSGDARKTWRLSERKLQRKLPRFRLVSYQDPILTPKKVEGRPSWMPMLASVKRTQKSKAQQTFEQALDWLLEVERSEQTVQQYAVRTERGDDGTVLLLWDKKRERDRTFHSAFQTFYAMDRPPFGDFFLRQNLEEGGQLLFEVDRWNEPGSRSRRRRTELRFVRRMDENRIQVEVEGDLPAWGWLRAEGAIGSLVMLLRQEKARQHLSEMPNLINQLIQPRTVRRLQQPWTGAGVGLRGNAGKIIRKMLDTRPFFALQGPPGTGKTTVTARAVAMALKHDRSQRILISAQSHYALDNLTKRIIQELRKAGLSDVPTLRIASEIGQDKIDDPEIKSLLPKHQVDRLLKRIKAAKTAGFGSHPKLMEIAGEWRRVASGHALEIQDRLRRGANVLFATTGTATAQFLGLEDERSVCDWAIIEEAGKAWPTELAIPMVQARRWTLIGDHLQLPPFGKERMEALLKRCRQEPDPEIQQHGERYEEYMKTFGLFGHLFESDSEATDSLKLQFRMDRTIGDMVSRAFYKDTLDTDESAGQGCFEVKRPTELQGHRLLWVESGPKAQEKPAWSNARETELVKRLVDDLMKNRPEPTIEQLAILSPYRQQCSDLRRALGQHASLVHTVDSFQGKEADIVIVSLVRVNRAETSRERLGFLAIPNRINVMLSRARRLLILVGSYEHFKGSGVQFWQQICAEVVTFGGGVSKLWRD